MKHFFGCRPPFARLATRERLLHWIMDRPPVLGALVCRHFLCVGGPVRAMILPIREQQIFRFAQENRVVADVAVGNLRQDFWPDGSVRSFVFGDPVWLDADHHAHALHAVPPYPNARLNSGRLLALIASLSHSTPMPGVIGAKAMPFSIRMDEVVT